MFMSVHVSLKQVTGWPPARCEGKLSFSSKTKVQMRESVNPCLCTEQPPSVPCYSPCYYYCSLLVLGIFSLYFSCWNKPSDKDWLFNSRLIQASLKILCSNDKIVLVSLAAFKTTTDSRPCLSLTEDFLLHSVFLHCIIPLPRLTVFKLNLLEGIYPIRHLNQLGWLTAGLCLAYS